MAAISALTDDFSTTTGLWGGDLTIANGVASIVADANYHSAYSNARYDAIGGAYAVKVTVPAGTSFDTSIRLNVDGSNYASALVISGKLYLRVRTAGTNVDTLAGTYDPTAHAYLRLRDTNNSTVSLDTSPDGVAWVARATASHTWTMASVGASLNAGSWDAAASGTATFDNVNRAGGSNPTTNGPPTVIMSGGRTCFGNDVVSVSCSAADPESIPTVTWTQVSGPAVTLIQSGAFCTFTAPVDIAEQTVKLRATASDGQLTASGDVSVVVLAAELLRRSSGAWVPALGYAGTVQVTPPSGGSTLPATLPMTLA